MRGRAWEDMNCHPKNKEHGLGNRTEIMTDKHIISRELTINFTRNPKSKTKEARNNTTQYNKNHKALLEFPE